MSAVSNANKKRTRESKEDNTSKKHKKSQREQRSKYDHSNSKNICAVHGDANICQMYDCSIVDIKGIEKYEELAGKNEFSYIT